eukprot:TRINITY_DN12897_c0_g1_i1.p1 TRINITY_DN12897_c0_g1~~TRINITY_DN12897_c0_g1_i1.p1  ORF type:complete len:214 (+),score=54.94 TRINITY_DN12897_c0_g1_i1:374-1015(+)
MEAKIEELKEQIKREKNSKRELKKNLEEIENSIGRVSIESVIESQPIPLQAPQLSSQQVHHPISYPLQFAGQPNPMVTEQDTIRETVEKLMKEMAPDITEKVVNQLRQEDQQGGLRIPTKLNDVPFVKSVGDFFKKTFSSLNAPSSNARPNVINGQPISAMPAREPVDPHLLNMRIAKFAEIFPNLQPVMINMVLLSNWKRSDIEIAEILSNL